MEREGWKDECRRKMFKNYGLKGERVKDLTKTLILLFTVDQFLVCGY